MAFCKVTWRQPGGLAECPYFRRTVFDFGRFAIRLHHWLAADDPRAYHDHAYWFVTLVLWGGYTDISPGPNGVKRDRLRIGSLRFRPARFQHTVQDPLPNTFTLLISGAATRRWGFWVNNKLIKRDRYFVTMGHHPCDPSHPPVRRRPDGSTV